MGRRNIDGLPKENFGVRVPIAAIEQLEQIAAVKKTNRNAIVNQAIAQFLYTHDRLEIGGHLPHGS